VSASSITLGPSLGEKVDAADQDHTSDEAFGWSRGIGPVS